MTLSISSLPSPRRAALLLALVMLASLFATDGYSAHVRTRRLRSRARRAASSLEAAPRLLGVCGRPDASALAFSGDGARLAVGSGASLTSASSGEVRVWEVATGHVMYTVPYPSPVSALAYAPVGDTLAASTVQSQATVWSAATGAPLRTLASPHAAGGLCLAFTPAGDVLATGGGDLAGNRWPGEARLWNVRTGNALSAASLPGRSVVSVQFSAKKNDCLVASRGLGPDSLGSVDLWDEHLKSRRWSRPASELAGAALVGGGAAVASVQTETVRGRYLLRVRLWSGKSGAPLNSYRIAMGGWAASPGGGLLACSADDRKSVVVRDIRTGRILRSLACDQPPGRLAFAFSPDGLQLAAGTPDGAVLLWSLK